MERLRAGPQRLHISLSVSPEANSCSNVRNSITDNHRVLRNLDRAIPHKTYTFRGQHPWILV